jgi:hypothetical protein
MTAVNKQDSNSTGLRFTRETAPGVLPVTPVWQGLEPNSYKDFGGQYKKVARNPINANRQRKKGVLVDLDASGGYQSDLTYSNLQQFGEGLIFADFRDKATLTATSVDTDDGYVVASGGATFPAGSLVYASGFGITGNNGVKVVTSSDATHVDAAGTADEATGGALSLVGYALGAADLVSVADGYTSTTFDFSNKGLVVGEWVFVGGDAAGDKFATAGANGYKRIAAIAANKLTIDKSSDTHATDAGTGKTVRLFFGRVLKNELGTDIKQYTYQFERTLGASDDADLTAVQAEYLTNALFNSATIAMNTADKITFDVDIMAGDYQTATSDDGLKDGTRPAIEGSDGFNTTSHVKRAALSIVGQQEALFAFLSDISLSINNNVKANKAIGYLGAFSHSAGDFEVNAACTAYFANVEAVQAVRDNEDVTLDVILARDGQGIVIDYPLVSLGDGRVKITMNEPITLGLSIDAATAVKNNANMDYTVLFTFFDYLPEAAM